tara:strand:- start:5104 stop:5322 length:219 start_codon:yes stop_codon:yes gene_type:complete
METYAVSSFLLNLTYLTVAVLALFFGLKALDKSLGNPFGAAYEIMAENPIALAIYYGLRMFAIAFLMGSLLS